MAALAVEQLEPCSVQSRARRGLVHRDMGFAIGEDALSGRTPDPKGDLVGHRAGRNEQRAFETEHVADLALKPALVRIFLVGKSRLVVRCRAQGADRLIGTSPQHVASQVDHESSCSRREMTRWMIEAPENAYSISPGKQ